MALTGRQLKVIQQLQSRHGRRKSEFVLCEGIHCCREVLRRKPDWIEFVVCADGFDRVSESGEVLDRCKGHGLAPASVTATEFARLATTEAPQGILAVLRRPAAGRPAAALPFVLVLDRLQDPGNLGTVLRGAWAIGLDSVWYTEGTTDPFGPKALRAGMGAQFAVGLVPLADMSAVRLALRRCGVERLWCAVARGGISCYDQAFLLSGSALVIGNEAAGVRDTTAAGLVTIPMPGGAESLNAAQAATVLLFEAVRRGLVQTATPRGGQCPGPGQG